MSTQTTTTCDFCGKQKKEVNHWWKVSVSALPVRGLVIRRFDGDLVSDWKDACGMQCCTQALARWMNYGTLDERTVDGYEPVRMERS